MIKLFTLADYNKWNDIVRSFKTYDVYYLSGYARAFEQNGDEKAVLIYFEKEDTRAINVVMKRDIADCDEFKTEIEQDKYCDFVTPYGYGGWIVEGEDYCSLKEKYEQFARRNGIVSEFVRFHPMIRNWENLGDIYEERFHGKTIFIDTSSEKIIWNNFTSQNRGKVRKAKKNGLKVYWSRDDRILDKFLDVYSETMDKDCAKNYYYFDRDFFESVMEDLKYNAMWFYAMKDDEMASAGVFLFSNGQMYYHLSGSRRKYQSLAPVNLLLYEASLWACHAGYKTLHLGGGVGAQEDNLYVVFKKSFNRYQDAEFHIGKKIFNPQIYQKLVDIRYKRQKEKAENTFFWNIELKKGLRE